MSRLDRVVMVAALGLLLGALIQLAPVFGGVGALVGGVAGVAVSRRVRRLSRRIDAVVGAGSAPQGLRLRRVGWRLAVQLGVLGSLLLGLGLLPFIGDELFAASGAVVTALPLVVTAAGLRRPARGPDAPRA